MSGNEGFPGTHYREICDMGQNAAPSLISALGCIVMMTHFPLSPQTWSNHVSLEVMGSRYR